MSIYYVRVSYSLSVKSSEYSEDIVGNSPQCLHTVMHHLNLTVEKQVSLYTAVFLNHCDEPLLRANSTLQNSHLKKKLGMKNIAVYCVMLTQKTTTHLELTVAVHVHCMKLSLVV